MNFLILKYIYSKILIYLIKIYKIIILVYGTLIFFPQYNTGVKPWLYITIIGAPFYVYLGKLIYCTFFSILPKLGLDFRQDFMLYIIKKNAYRIKKFSTNYIFKYNLLKTKPTINNCLGKIRK